MSTLEDLFPPAKRQEAMNNQAKPQSKDKRVNMPPKTNVRQPESKMQPISAPNPQHKNALHNVYQNMVPESAGVKNDETLDNIIAR